MRVPWYATAFAKKFPPANSVEVVFLFTGQVGEAMTGLLSAPNSPALRVDTAEPTKFDEYAPISHRYLPQPSFQIINI